MTPEQWADATVRIATGLMGWEKDGGPTGDQFRLTKPRACVTFTDNYLSIMHEWSANGEGPYLPDLTTLDGCAEFERELAKRGWLQRYIAVLVLSAIHGGKTHRSDAEVVLLATTEQRVQACLKVMEEAGL